MSFLGSADVESAGLLEKRLPDAGAGGGFPKSDFYPVFGASNKDALLVDDSFSGSGFPLF